MRWLKENKYHNKWVIIDGIKFQSEKEGKRWQELKLMERAGEISGLARQVQIEIIPKTKLFRAAYYIPDIVYVDNRTGKRIYEDAKGYRTKEYQLKKKLLYWRHGIEILET